MALWLLLVIGLSLSVLMLALGVYLWLPRHSAPVREMGTALLTGAAIATALFVVEALFDARAQVREERRGLQLELGRQRDLSGADLSERDLSGFFLKDKELTGADLRKANLEGTVLRGAELVGANLEGADLRSADLTDATLYYANLRGARLDGANLEGAKLRGARAGDATFAGARLVFADLRADLRGAKLHGANLSAADLRDAILTRAELNGANLEDVRLAGARLERADLSDVQNFETADISHASFDGQTDWPPEDEWPEALRETRCPPCVARRMETHSFRTSSPALRTLRKLLSQRLPQWWQEEEDPVGFRFAAPGGAATFFGEDQPRGGRTLHGFAYAYRPKGFPGLEGSPAIAVRLLDGIDGCVRHYSYTAKRQAPRRAIDLYLTLGRFGYILVAEADTETFQLYASDFRQLFDALRVAPSPLLRGGRSAARCGA